MRGALFFVLCMGALLSGFPSLGATAPPSLACPHEDGFLAGATAEAARSLYLTIRSGVEPGYKPPERRWIVVEDEGDHWSIYTSAPLKSPEGKWIFLQGGGGLALELESALPP